MATYNTTTYSHYAAPSTNLVDRIIPFTYTIAGAIADADIVNLCKVPKGYNIVAVAFTTSAAVATVGGTVKVGTDDGTTNSATSIYAAVTATSAVVQAPVASVTIPNIGVAETRVYATLNGTSGFTTGTTLKGYVLATPMLA